MRNLQARTVPWSRSALRALQWRLERLHSAVWGVPGGQDGTAAYGFGFSRFRRAILRAERSHATTDQRGFVLECGDAQLGRGITEFVLHRGQEKIRGAGDSAAQYDYVRVKRREQRANYYAKM